MSNNTDGDELDLMRHALYEMTAQRAAPKIAAIRKKAAIYERKHVREPYYLEPDDGSCEYYCEKCAQKKLDDEPTEYKEMIYAGDTDHDSENFCDVCGCRLEGSLTKYGADELFDWMERDFDRSKHEHCYVFALCEDVYSGNSIFSEDYQRLCLVALGEVEK